MTKTNALVLGPIGSGKTDVIRTLLPHYRDHHGVMREGAGKEVMLLALEGGAETTLGGITCDDGLHIKSHLPAQVDWETMADWVEKLGNNGMDEIAKMTVPAAVRREFDQFLKLYVICTDFKCDRCEKSFGHVAEWDEGRVFVNDGLSGLSDMARQYIVGPKPIMSLPQYGAAQELILNYLKQCVGIKSSYILIAHWAREVSEVTGRTSITVDTVGVKLAPKILKVFDEIVVAKRDGTKFFWSTLEDGIELKARRLPYSDNIEPNFKALL